MRHRSVTYTRLLSHGTRTGLILATIAFATLFVGCKQRYVPKPYGYCRIDLPEHTYRQVQPTDVPIVFDISTSASIVQHDDPTWFDIKYPTLNAVIYCNYKPVNHNLRQLSDDAQEFVFKHSGKASSIPEQGFADEQNKVYGVYYELRGNTASPQQFYLTDSTRHFFRGSVYFNCIPNQDSLAPVVNFLDDDLRHLIESVRWTAD
ncbi:MAG: gliding motility lipoprotein GldD [Paludibacteraceae bacterium]|nr:gliding motility lipoprotein GldD [Paludibacteraceae bacterium]